MGKTIIAVDSTCDLSKEMIELTGITFVPQTVRLTDKDGKNAKNYLDGLKINSLAMIQVMEREGKKATLFPTSQSEFTQFFQEQVLKENEIFYLGASNAISMTVANASMALGSLMTDKISVLDSKCISAGATALAMKAAELESYGMTSKAISYNIGEILSNVRTYFALQERETLDSSGICPIPKKMLTSDKAIIGINNGTLTVLSRPKVKKDLDLYGDLINAMKAEISKCDGDVYISHAYNKEAVAYLTEKLNALGCKSIKSVVMGAGNTTLFGKGAVCVGFIKKVQ